MFEFISPLGLIKLLYKLFKKGIDILFRKAFLTSYLASHKKYLKRRYGLRFEKLVGDIEYHLTLESADFTNDDNPCSMLYLKIPKAYEGATIRGKVCIRNGSLRYQEHFVVDCEGETLMPVKLTSLPLLKLSIDSDSNIRGTVGEYYIEGTLCLDQEKHFCTEE